MAFPCPGELILYQLELARGALFMTELWYSEDPAIWKTIIFYERAQSVFGMRRVVISYLGSHFIFRGLEMNSRRNCKVWRSRPFPDLRTTVFITMCFRFVDFSFDFVFYLLNFLEQFRDFIRLFPIFPHSWVDHRIKPDLELLIIGNRP